MSTELECFLVIAILAILLWCLHLVAIWRVECLLDLLERMVADGIAPSEESLDRLADALADAAPVWEPGTARGCQLAVGATTTRKIAFLSLAREATASARTAERLERARLLCARTCVLTRQVELEERGELDTAVTEAAPP